MSYEDPKMFGPGVNLEKAGFPKGLGRLGVVCGGLDSKRDEGQAGLSVKFPGADGLGVELPPKPGLEHELLMLSSNLSDMTMISVS